MENGEDPFADIWISNWERQCEIELENEPDLEGQVLSERDLATQKLWYLFQNSATAVAQLFKGEPFDIQYTSWITSTGLAMGSSVVKNPKYCSPSLVNCSALGHQELHCTNINHRLRPFTGMLYLFNLVSSNLSRYSGVGHLESFFGGFSTKLWNT